MNSSAFLFLPADAPGIGTVSEAGRPLQIACGVEAGPDPWPPDVEKFALL